MFNDSRHTLLTIESILEITFYNKYRTRCLLLFKNLYLPNYEMEISPFLNSIHLYKVIHKKYFYYNPYTTE